MGILSVRLLSTPLQQDQQQLEEYEDFEQF